MENNLNISELMTNGRIIASKQLKEGESIEINSASFTRPFFSIIVPCYNSDPENIHQLLYSIKNGGCTDDIEVIICDGGSTDKTYLEEVLSFNHRANMNIRIVSMPDKDENDEELVHCPGNTREYGVIAAKGQWITFIDHDDMYIGKVFDKIKKVIEETNELYIICSQILQVNPDTDEVMKEITFATNWMHGKFYNLDNLWNAYDFHFKKNLVSNEDIYISNRMHSILYQIKNLNVLWINDFTYMWKSWPNSTSHKKYSDELNYMEYYFFDYIEATYNVHTEEYNKLLKNGSEISDDLKYHFIKLQADALLFQYFYLQSFKFFNPNWRKEHEDIVKQNIKKFYERFDIGADQLYSIACDELDNDDIRDGGFITKIWYNNVRYNVTVSCGNFIETDNFVDFIRSV